MDHGRFSRDMRRTEKRINRGIRIVVILQIIFVVAVSIALFYLILNWDDIVKGAGMKFETTKEKFEEGRQEVASDSIHYDSIPK